MKPNTNKKQDGSIVVVAHNNVWDASQSVSVEVEGTVWRLPDMAQESMATYRFQASGTVY